MTAPRIHVDHRTRHPRPSGQLCLAEAATPEDFLDHCSMLANPLTAPSFFSRFDDIARVRFVRRIRLAVVAEGLVALRYRTRDALPLGELDETLRVGGVSHQAVEDRAEGLG